MNVGDNFPRRVWCINVMDRVEGVHCDVTCHCLFFLDNQNKHVALSTSECTSDGPWKDSHLKPAHWLHFQTRTSTPVSHLQSGNVWGNNWGIIRFWKSWIHWMCIWFIFGDVFSFRQKYLWSTVSKPCCFVRLCNRVTEFLDYKEVVAYNLKKIFRYFHYVVLLSLFIWSLSYICSTASLCSSVFSCCKALWTELEWMKDFLKVVGLISWERRAVMRQILQKL